MPRPRDPQALRSLGGRIRTLRHARGMTQEQLAAAVDLHTPAVSRIESGKLGVSTSMLVRFGEALGVTVSELFAAGPAPEPTALLDGEERLLVDRWRSLGDRERHVVRSVLAWAAAASHGGLARPPSWGPEVPDVEDGLLQVRPSEVAHNERVNRGRPPDFGSATTTSTRRGRRPKSIRAETDASEPAPPTPLKPR